MRWTIRSVLWVPTRWVEKGEQINFEVHVETDTFASGYYFLGYEDRILLMTFTQVYAAIVKRNQWLLKRGEKARIKRLPRDFWHKIVSDVADFINQYEQWRKQRALPKITCRNYEVFQYHPNWLGLTIVVCMMSTDFSILYYS